ncbi:LysM domain-containing protein [Cordyceps javanica]|uniref:LysM domain-containing protein n=1 Tax=Cordyceps javanica TaxID=43265 RepID=A0A545VBY5_9HYPO|nr:LysM domain-containing protein [Cordyceps javanica]TQW11099.1 LysM domain protein [Cordyceps javanica]
MSNLRNNKTIRGGYKFNSTRALVEAYGGYINSGKVDKCSASSDYWLPQLAALGSQPLAGSGYKFYRNVADYGADCTGTTDASEAINAAISDGKRCGQDCGNDFTQGAIIYFPPGTYLVCTPIIQLYYTQFIGDALNPPTIQGCSNFSGIALVDTDPYIPGASGNEWYINQNQFFRQIRNFVFDLTLMPMSTDVDNQPLVPTGIHWQVAQATSLQNLVFKMPNATSSQNTTAVGIFSENGSGGFVSDLKFNGGSIGWRAGSQQYTARNLEFNGCLTAVQMVWDWGWIWQNVNINGGAIGFNISGIGGSTGQGIGSISVLDSSITGVPVGILTNSATNAPDIVLDNVYVKDVGVVVQADKGDALLKTSGTIDLWTVGKVYNGSHGSYVTGSTKTPAKAKSLLDDKGKLYVRSRPQYEKNAVGDFSVATKDGGCKNDGTGDQSSCLNKFLASAVSDKKIAYFPAGIYQIGGTILIPTGSRVQGASWSQIQGSGAYFSDMANPKVMVQVGNAGEIGTVEIVEMLFSVRGNTAGAILMEWNTAGQKPGDAAMWDSHFRVGGAAGSDLGIDNCPIRQFKEQCIAATLMFHVTKQAAGYFENVWAWVADHDNDMNVTDEPNPAANQISVYGARGMLIESQGPSWFYGTGSEHSVLYNYQVSGATDIYMGHIQTETPYYQPNPIAPAPFAANLAKGFPNDPDFSKCKGNTACAASWGLRVIDSKAVTIHGAGLYSFFQDNYQDCLDTHNCQEHVLEVTGSYDVVVFNLFTVAISKIAIGIDSSVIYQNDSNQRGFTSEDSVWVPLPGVDNVNEVYVGTEVWTQPVVSCTTSSCLLIFPTSSLPSPTTIHPGTYPTSFEYGGMSTVTIDGRETVSFVTTTITTTLTVPDITVTGMSYSNYNISSGSTNIVVSPSVNLPPVSIPLPDGSGKTTTRVVPIPPWPRILSGPSASNIGPGPTDAPNSTFYQGITSTVTISGPTVTTVSFPGTVTPSTIVCPPDDSITFATPSATFYTECTSTTTIVIGFNCPTTKVVTFLGPTTAPVAVDCSMVTRWTTTTPHVTTTSTSSTPLPVYVTWPPDVIFPITTKVDKPEPTGGGGTKEPCELWFFNICIIRDRNIIIGGWLWQLPPGIYPPGPPPPIIFPPGVSITGTLPPWPEITVGRDGQPTAKEKPSECETKSATLCSTGYVYSVTTTNGTPTTTETKTTSECGTVYGCEATDSSTTSRSTTTRTCTPTPQAAIATGLSGNSTNGTLENRAIHRRADACPELRAIVYPANPSNPAPVVVMLARANLNYQAVDANGFTAYYWVSNLPDKVFQQLKDSADVTLVYYYVEYNRANPLNPDREDAEAVRSAAVSLPLDESLLKRAVSSIREYWPPALMSLPPGLQWRTGNSVTRQGFKVFYNYYYDDSAGSGATVYTPGDGGVWQNHPEFASIQDQLSVFPRNCDYGYSGGDNARFSSHGSQVAAVVIGTQLGICKKCKLVYSNQKPPVPDGSASDPDSALYLQPREWYIDDLLSAWHSIHTKGSPQKSIINMSWGHTTPFFHYSLIRTMYRILREMDKDGITIVAASGNYAEHGRANVDTWPQLLADPNHPYAGQFREPGDNLGYLPNLIVVGAVDQWGGRAEFTQAGPLVQVYASGKNIFGPSSATDYDKALKGTSFAAPQVAALAAYLKQLKSIWQDDLNQASPAGPAAVKAMIIKLQREINAGRPVDNPENVVWNGMSGNTSCLTDYPHGGDPDGVCKDLPKDITTGNCGNSGHAKRDGGGGGGGGGSCTVGPRGSAVSVGVTTGPTVSPTCASSCGGFRCTDYWCNPQPTNDPPGYQDPKDPRSDGATAPTTTIGTTTSHTTAPPPPPTKSTGIALAAYTTCVRVGGPCAWQWEVYTLPDAKATSFDGCDAKAAIFTKVTSVAPAPTDGSTVGPFDVAGRKNCYVYNRAPPTFHCDGDGLKSCQGCAQDNTCLGSDSHSCGHNLPKGYFRDAYCYF